MSNGNELFREWDLYERIARADYMKQRVIAGRICEMLRTRTEPIRVLDLGCGDGGMSHSVLSNTRITKFVGVDLSESAIERLQQRILPGSSPEEVDRELICDDMEHAIRKFPDNAFNIIHASYSLHHYQRNVKLQVLAEAARILEPGGLLIWTDIVLLERETREEYLERLSREIASQWVAISQEERLEVIRHIHLSDYPEHPSWMIESAESFGFRLMAELFLDSFYIAVCFSKQT